MKIPLIGISAAILVTGIGSNAMGQDRVCPDGGKSYFGYCPSDRPAPNLLQQQLEQWAYYPDDLQSKAPPDIIEDLYIDKVPQKLYDILVPYDRQTILLTPSIGSDLQNFKNLYYISRKNEIIFEQKVFVRAGTLVSSRPADAWRECVRYFILRSTNHSQEQLKLEPQFLFYINFDEAEKAYLQLSVDKTISAELQAMARDHGTIRQASSDIAQRIRASSATPSKN